MFQIGEPVKVKSHIPFLGRRVGKIKWFHDGNEVAIKVGPHDFIHVKVDEIESMLRLGQNVRVKRKATFFAGKQTKFVCFGKQPGIVILGDNLNDMNKYVAMKLTDIDVV